MVCVGTKLTIGKLAKAADVGAETLRFYERKGLLPAPPRTDGGYRVYPDDAVNRVRFIRRAKHLGFSLAEIGDLLALSVRPGVGCDRVRARAEGKQAEILARIRELERMHRALGRLAAACSGRGPATECPIIDALEREARDNVVELVCDDDCPHVEAARAVVTEAMTTAGLVPRWQEYRSGHPDTPAHARGYGSPTILVDGVDVVGVQKGDTASCCRVYPTDTGFGGVPAVEAIIRALEASQQ